MSSSRTTAATIGRATAKCTERVTRQAQQKRRGSSRAFFFPLVDASRAISFAPALVQRRRRRAWRLALLPFELLARLFGFLLQLFLQFALLLFECLRVGRRPVIGLGEIAKRQRQADRSALHVDRLHDDVLPLLHLGNHVIGHLVVGHAADREADAVGRLGRRILIDEQTRPVRKLHAERNGDAQYLRAAFRLEQLHDRDRHAVLETAILGDDADLLVVGVRSLAADFHPRRIHQLRLFGRRLAGLAAPGCCGAAGCVQQAPVFAPPPAVWGPASGCWASALDPIAIAAAKPAAKVAVSARPHGRADAIR